LIKPSFTYIRVCSMSEEREEKPEPEPEKEIPMYCCLPFSYAVHYSLIKIDYERNDISMTMKSSLTEGEKEEIWQRLKRIKISYIDPDIIHIVHCPWCGLRINHAVFPYRAI
jgi:hypothetical protein